VIDEEKDKPNITNNEGSQPTYHDDNGSKNNEPLTTKNDKLEELSVNEPKAVSESDVSSNENSQAIEKDLENVVVSKELPHTPEAVFADKPVPEHVDTRNEMQVTEKELREEPCITEISEQAPKDTSKGTAEPKWYVVHTYSGYEQKAKIALEERIKQKNLEKYFEKILIPSENVIELVRGQKKTTTRKFFPGYMLVKMILNETTWHLVKNTPKITGFVGNAINPPAVPEEEVARITNQMEEGTLKPRPKVEFEAGDSVRVIDGPFVNFNGIVEEVRPDKGKLRVMVSIFGRSTPVELDFVQVEKN